MVSKSPDPMQKLFDASFLTRKTSPGQIKQKVVFRPLNPEKLLQINPPCACPVGLWRGEQGLERSGKAIWDGLFSYELNSSFALPNPRFYRLFR